MSKRVLARVEADCYYGVISGLFICEERDIKRAIGKTVQVGEVLGKHSEVEFDLRESEVDIFEFGEDVLVRLEAMFGSTLLCGYDILSCINPEQFDDDEDEDNNA